MINGSLNEHQRPIIVCQCNYKATPKKCTSVFVSYQHKEMLQVKCSHEKWDDKSKQKKNVEFDVGGF